MSPDLTELQEFMTRLAVAVSTGTLGGYPVALGGIRATCVGSITPQGDGNFSSSPLAIIVNDELLAAMDLTEARSD